MLDNISALTHQITAPVAAQQQKPAPVISVAAPKDAITLFAGNTRQPILLNTKQLNGLLTSLLGDTYATQQEAPGFFKKLFSKPEVLDPQAINQALGDLLANSNWFDEKLSKFQFQLTEKMPENEKLRTIICTLGEENLKALVQHLPPTKQLTLVNRVADAILALTPTITEDNYQGRYSRTALELVMKTDIVTKEKYGFESPGFGMFGIQKNDFFQFLLAFTSKQKGSSAWIYQPLTEDKARLAVKEYLMTRWGIEGAVVKELPQASS